MLCVQLASYLEVGPLMWMMPLHVNKKLDYDMIVKYDTKLDPREYIVYCDHSIFCAPMICITQPLI